MFNSSSHFWPITSPKRGPFRSHLMLISKGREEVAIRSAAATFFGLYSDVPNRHSLMSDPKGYWENSPG